MTFYTDIYVNALRVLVISDPSLYKYFKITFSDIFLKLLLHIIYLEKVNCLLRKKPKLSKSTKNSKVILLNNSS